MSHFLTKDELESRLPRYSQEHAVVEVSRSSDGRLHMTDAPIGIVKDGIPFIELLERYDVVYDGRVVGRQRGLVRVVSLSTFDPCHLVADVDEGRWASWSWASRI